MNIREMQKADCANLAALSIQVWLHTYATDGIRDALSGFVFDHFTPASFEKIFHSENQKLFVCTNQDHLVAYITIDLAAVCEAGKEYGHEIATLYVQEHFQGQGIGARLIEQTAAQYGPPCWLTTWIHNTPAIGFYEHLGFQNVGHTWFHLDSEKHKNLILARL